MPNSQAEEEWYYRRSGTIMRSPYRLNAHWFVPGLQEYLAPNAVAEAARSMGVTDDSVRIVIARAGMIEGLKFAEWEVAVQAAVRGCSLNAGTLRSLAQSQTILDRMRATTAEFQAFKMTSRPSFLLESNIGDRVVFSGLATIEPLESALSALLRDAKAYASYAAHHGSPPE